MQIVYLTNAKLQIWNLKLTSPYCSSITPVTRPFKGTVSRDFLLLVFYESVSPQPQSIPLGPFRIFSKICGDIRKSRCTTSINDTSGKFCHQFHQCCLYRWLTMGTISGCRYLEVNMKAKNFIYVNSTIQRCPNKIIKIFLIEDFFICHPTPVVNLELRISPRSRKSRGTVPLSPQRQLYAISLR